MYAQLGNITFENLTGWNEFSRSGSVSYAEHKPLTGKPLLQPTGQNLDEISLSMRLHAAFKENPSTKLNQLKQYRDTNEILLLKSGNGRIEGEFVITELSESVEDADPQGNIFSYLVTCTLKEFHTIDKVQAQQDQHRKQAAAVGDKKAAAKKKTNPPSCPQTISKIISSIDSYSKSIDQVLQQKGGGSSATNRYTINQNADNISAQAGDLIKRCDDASSCAYGVANLKQSASQVSFTAYQFKSGLQSVTDSGLQEINRQLIKDVAQLKAAARPLVQKSITG